MEENPYLSIVTHTYKASTPKLFVHLLSTTVTESQKQSFFLQTAGSGDPEYSLSNVEIRLDGWGLPIMH